MLKTAVEWDVLDRMHCAIRLLPIQKSSASFHDFDDFERLVEAAKYDRQAHLIVLLGGAAGLRCGEMMALEWKDVDFRKRQLTVQRSDWKGHVTTPKSARLRYIPLTVRLEAALRDHRSLKAVRVLCSDNGGPLTQREVQGLVRRAARRANLDNVGVHVLPHTFCSHLAIGGAPTRAFQELAGHAEMVTTRCWTIVATSWQRLPRSPKKSGDKGEIWLRGRDLNPRPLGYEPNELPDCSTPRHREELLIVAHPTIKPPVAQAHHR